MPVPIFGPLAHLVEHLICNEGVAGSSPVGSTKKQKARRTARLLLYPNCDACYSEYMESIAFFTDIKIPMTVVHVLSVVFGMGSALLSDVLFTFYSRDKKLSQHEIHTLGILSRIVWFSLIFIFLSGIALFLSDVPKYTQSVKFLGKMSIMAVLLVNGFILDRFIWPHLGARSFLTAKKNMSLRKTAFICGAISVFSWISVCILGVLSSVPITYHQLMAIYAGVLLVAIPGAILVEYFEFEQDAEK
jgi:hypothetical protein